MKNTSDEKNIVYGKNPIVEILENNPLRINKIFIQDKISFDNKLKKIVDLARDNKILVKFTNINNFFEEHVAHQGVVALVSPVEYIELEDFLNLPAKSQFKKLIVLDEISDPHNFGAIIRTVACAGFDGVLVSNHRSCPVTNVVEKVSMGGVNHINIIKTNSISASIDYLKKNNWWIIATDAECKDNYFDIDYTDMNFAVIMGSEGKGISKTLLNKADFKVKIPTNFESLNVSNAAAILMFEFLRQQEV